MSAAHRTLACLVLLLAPPVLAVPPDWQRLAEVQAVQVVTADPDGEPRNTTVWLVVVDGQPYIRTSGTRWGANLLRDPELALRTGDESWELRVAFVEDAVLREKVEDTFSEKYGFNDAVIDIFRGGSPLIMRLEPRRVDESHG